MNRFLVQLLMEYGSRAGKSFYKAYSKIVTGKSRARSHILVGLRLLMYQ